MINSIHDLILNLKKANPKDYPKLIKQIDIPNSAFDKYILWKGSTYSRNCIIRTEQFELMLICWEEKQQTQIHDHGGEKCWVYQIKGEAIETRYTLDENNKPIPTSTLTLKPGSLTYMDDKMGYHALETLEDKALTLHLYANPIDECKVFNEKLNGFESKISQYDTQVEEEYSAI